MPQVSPADASLRGHIDRLRGAFAICVMLGHAIDLAYGHGTPDYSFQVLMPLRPLLGFVWVVGFIVLSGYCVTGSCLRASKQTLGGFGVLRASRLFPLLWVSIILAVGVEAAIRGSVYRPQVWAAGIDQRHVWINLIGMGGFYGQFGSLAPAYTLSYEIVFYALWAAAWFGTRRRPALAMLCCAALSFGLFVGGRTLIPGGHVVFNDFVLLLFLCWCIGAAMALWLPQLCSLPLVRAIAPFRWIAVIGVMWIGFSRFQMPLLQATPVSAAYYLGLSAAFALLTAGFVARNQTVPPSRIDEWLGAISYPLFITHGPVIIGVATLYRQIGLTLSFGPYLLAIAAPALLAGWFFALAVDNPVMALRQRLRSKPAVAPATGNPIATAERAPV